MSFLEQATAAYYAARDPATPTYAKAGLIAALAYFIFPTDAVPDVITGIGFTDDAAVLSAVLRALTRHVKLNHVERARAFLDRQLRAPSAVLERTDRVASPSYQGLSDFARRFATGSTPALAAADDVHAPAHQRADVALLLNDFHGGGVQRNLLRLGSEFVRQGLRVDAVVCNPQGSLSSHVPEGVRLATLRHGSGSRSKFASRLLTLRADPAGIFVYLRPILLARKSYPHLRYLADLVEQLERSRPQAIISAMPEMNMLAAWASRLVSPRPRLVVTERCVHLPSLRKERLTRWRDRYLPQVMRRAYCLADEIIAVSNGVAEDLSLFTGMPRNRIKTVYNPVVTPGIGKLATEPVDHPWLIPGGPTVILGVGRLSVQKDFSTLVRAFARVRSGREAKLIILGEGADPLTDKNEREALIALALELGVATDLSLPGWVANPFAYMARASLFVLSSRWEGLPTVLVEAMACGCPVVSTECPSGPAEILAEGRYGRLVPVQNEVALAEAIDSTLDRPLDRAILRDRAQYFSLESHAARYLDLLTFRQDLGSSGGPCANAEPHWVSS